MPVEERILPAPEPINPALWGQADPQSASQQTTVNARTIIPVREQPQTSAQRVMTRGEHFHPYAGQVLSYPDTRPHMIYGDLYDVTAPYVNAIIPWLEMGARIYQQGSKSSSSNTAKAGPSKTTTTQELKNKGVDISNLDDGTKGPMQQRFRPRIEITPEGELAAVTQPAATTVTTPETEAASPYDVSTAVKGAAIGTGLLGGKALFDWLHSPVPITSKSQLLSLPMGAIPQPAAAPRLALPAGAIPQPAAAPRLALPEGAIPMPPAASTAPAVGGGGSGFSWQGTGSTPYTPSQAASKTTQTPTVVEQPSVKATPQMTPQQYIDKSRQLAKQAGVPTSAAQTAQQYIDESRRIAEARNWAAQSRALASSGANALRSAAGAAQRIATHPYTALGAAGLGLGAEILDLLAPQTAMAATPQTTPQQMYARLAADPNTIKSYDGAIFVDTGIERYWLYPDGTIKWG